jgi:hypothetical protein
MRRAGPALTASPAARRFGFPVPYLMVGRWLLSPLPRQTPLVYVVGEPLAPPALAEGEQVAAAQVDELHSRYFAAMQELFEQHKAKHPEYASARLVLAAD